MSEVPPPPPKPLAETPLFRDPQEFGCTELRPTAATEATQSRDL